MRKNKIVKKYLIDLLSQHPCFLDYLKNWRLISSNYVILKMLMIRKAVNFWKMGGVVVSKDKIISTILKMIAITKMSDVFCFNNC